EIFLPRLPTASQASSAAGQFEGLTEVNQPDHKVSDDLEARLDPNESVLSLLKQQYNHLFRIHQETIEEYQNLKERARQTEQELESTSAKVSGLKHQIRVCEDDLLNFQPRNIRSDSEIAQAYGDLHRSIDIWMGGEIWKFETKFEKHPQGPLPDMFRHRDIGAIRKLLLDYPTFGGEYLVRCLLQAGLQKLVFAQEILLVGLDDPRSELLRRMHEQIHETVRPKNIWLADIWLAQSLAALSTMRGFEQSRQSACFHIATRIFNYIAKFFPVIEDNNQSLQLLAEEVVCPAIKLAETIRTSPCNYVFKPTMSDTRLFKECELRQEHLSQLKLIDIGTGKTLKPQSPVQPEEDGSIGQQIMMLAPALYRCNQGIAPLLLVKELDLVKLHKPLGRQGAATARQEPTDVWSLDLVIQLALRSDPKCTLMLDQGIGQS
ncbi:MAG: hypothetical protein Q9200_003631, partial [Gallowayella weberi]